MIVNVRVTDIPIYFSTAFFNINLPLQDKKSSCIASHKALHLEFQWQWAGAFLQYQTNLK
jgi:hypothetical protein